MANVMQKILSLYKKIATLFMKNEKQRLRKLQILLKSLVIFWPPLVIICLFTIYFSLPNYSICVQLCVSRLCSHGVSSAV
jgi:hypothetical protein